MTPVLKNSFGVLASLLSLAFPMFLGQVGQVLLQLTDTVMIGHLGVVPLAGAALAGNFVMVTLYFASGAVGAVGPRIGHAFGAKDDAAVVNTLRAGILLAAIIGLAIALVLTALVPLLGRLGQPPEVAGICGGYLILIAWSLPAGIVAMVLSQAAESVNRPWPVLGFMILAVAVNALLNWLLIYGNGGCPALGLDGAGWATCLTRWLHAAALAIWIGLDRGLGRYPIGPFSVILNSNSRRELGILFRFGLPAAAQDILEGGAFAAGALMLGWVGTTALAANQVTLGIASLAWMFPISLSMATCVRVAHAIGAGDLAQARRTGIVAVLLGAGLMAACAVVYTTCGMFLAQLFTDNDEVAGLAATLITIAGIYQISDAIQSVSLGALRGLLDNRVPMIANFVCYWLFSLPTVYLLAFYAGWGARGVWIGFLPWMALTGLFFLWRFLRLTAAETIPASAEIRALLQAAPLNRL
ncbi:MAG: MATE family efflux transporter [Planctomycetia bacterium]|nr:MATE family efflux transporter [Planctomycetia bacterium]